MLPNLRKVNRQLFVSSVGKTKDDGIGSLFSQILKHFLSIIRSHNDPIRCIENERIRRRKIKLGTLDLLLTSINQIDGTATAKE